ncbi:MAG: ankyrin repeat domain-containing protein, partial [Planctomycetota bacterium]
DAQAPDGTGRTPLHFAARWRRSVLAAFLLEEGADPNARAEADLTPLHELAGAARLADPQSGTAMVLEDPEGEKTLAILLGRSATPDARDATGATPLHWAVRNGTVLLVDQLLAAGADPAIRDNAGCTPLFVALLRARRTETDATGDADRLLVQCLLDRGAAPDAPGPAGMTPLYFAACIGRMNLVELLLQKGADPDLRTHAGLAPLDRAEAAGNAALAAQLRAAGATDEATGAAYLRRSGEGDAETLRGRMVEEDRLIETLLAD